MSVLGETGFLFLFFSTPGRQRGTAEDAETVCSLVPRFLVETHFAWPPEGMRGFLTAKITQVSNKEFDRRVGSSHSHAEPGGTHLVSHFGQLK